MPHLSDMDELRLPWCMEICCVRLFQSPPGDYHQGLTVVVRLREAVPRFLAVCARFGSKQCMITWCCSNLGDIALAVANGFIFAVSVAGFVQSREVACCDSLLLDFTISVVLGRCVVHGTEK